MNKKLLGIDISDNSISAILISSGIKENKIEAFETIDIIETGKQEGKENEIEFDISQSLGKLISKIDIKNVDCYISLSASKFFFRNINLPFNKEKKIKQILSYELESFLPVLTNDLMLDFQVLKNLNQSDETLNNKTDLITAAISSNTINQYLNVFKSYNLKLKAITIAGISSALYFSKLIKSSYNQFIFMSLGEKSCSLFFVFLNQLCFIRSFSVNETISLESLTLKVNQAILSFRNQYGIDYCPEKIFYTGCDFDEEFLNDFNKEFEISIEKAEIIKKSNYQISNNLKENILAENAFALAICGNSGNITFNFLQGSFAPKYFYVEHKKSLITTGVLLGALLIALLLNLFFDNYMMKGQIKYLDKQILKVFKTALPNTKVINSSYAMQQMQSKISELKNKPLLLDESKNIVDSIDILNAVSKQISSKRDVELKRLVIGHDNILLSGETDSFNSVDDMKNQLEKVSFFKKVKISSANLEKSNSRINFKLKIELKG